MNTNHHHADPVVAGQRLYDSATHFVQKDWRYTRKHNIQHIRYKGDWSGYEHPLRRVARVAKKFVHRNRIEREVFGQRFPMAWRHPLIAIRAGLRTDKNLPDGVLDGSSIITHWEEDGEYLQMVQPSVGALVAEFMMSDPDHPYAQKIAAKQAQIAADYQRRINEGQVE